MELVGTHEYSQAVRVNNLLLLSGQVPLDAKGNLVGAEAVGVTALAVPGQLLEVKAVASFRKS